MIKLKCPTCGSDAKCGFYAPCSLHGAHDLWHDYPKEQDDEAYLNWAKAWSINNQEVPNPKIVWQAACEWVASKGVSENETNS